LYVVEGEIGPIEKTVPYNGGREVAPKTIARLKLIFRALHYRNFRLFFMGQSISLIGTWMQRIALGWLVYQLTHSAFLLGLVSFSAQIPTLIVAPVAGVLADRWDRYRLLVVTQTLAMLQAFVLAFLVLTGLIHIWHIVVLSIILGIINAFDMPIRQAFMVQMVDDKKDLGNAIALNSSMVNGARLLGPSTAGLLIAAVGTGICFLINALTYIAVIVSLLMMKIAKTDGKPARTRGWHELKEGLRYVSGFEPIWAVLLMLAVMSAMGMPYAMLMPVFAKDILHGGPDTLGFLMGASGVGALTGALYLAAKKSVLGLGRLIPIASATFGVTLIIFSFSHYLWLSLILLVFSGVGMMVQLASSNTLLQTMVEDDKRGRVMSLYSMAFVGMMPVGSLIGGTVANHIGAPWTVFGGGLACVIGAAVFASRLPVLREKIRPVYAELGILPEIAAGLQSAAESPLPDKYPKE
jgi:MFS family permease